jgi:hypothetical protein
MCLQNKLTKVQGEVDLLVEAAKVMAVEVEQKVASANAFAEQVGIEKEKVNAENGGWQGYGMDGNLGYHVLCCGQSHERLMAC